MKTLIINQNISRYLNQFKGLVLFSVLLVLASCTSVRTISNSNEQISGAKQHVTSLYEASNSTTDNQLHNSITSDNKVGYSIVASKKGFKNQDGTSPIELVNVSTDFNYNMKDTAKDSSKVESAVFSEDAQKLSSVQKGSQNKPMRIQTVEINKSKHKKTPGYRFSGWLNGLNHFRIYTQ